MDSYVLVSFIMLLVFLLGVYIGSILSIKFVDKNEFKSMLIYVDEDNNRKKKKPKAKKKVKDEELDDEDDMFLLCGRISDEVSITERECISKGLDIQEVVKENQTDVDNAFEYLAIENDEDDEFDEDEYDEDNEDNSDDEFDFEELDEIGYIEEVDVTDELNELSDTEE